MDKFEWFTYREDRAVVVYFDKDSDYTRFIRFPIDIFGLDEDKMFKGTEYITDLPRNIHKDSRNAIKCQHITN